MTTPNVEGVDDPLALLGRIGIVPVATIHDVAHAVPLVRALADGGLSAVEITLRTPVGLDAISLAATESTDVLIGAGSVMTGDHARAAIDAGARFIVSPGLDDGVVAAAREHDVAVLPGVATATELMRAVALGVETVKVFPAASLGGPAFVHALAAVWPLLRFVPTGGISGDTAPAYLAEPSVLAVGGSWMIPTHAVAEQRWDEITLHASSAVELTSNSRRDDRPARS